MANDLLTILNNSGVQQSNNALYQAIKGLIDKLTTPVISSKQITVTEVQTNLGAVTIYLNLISGLTIIKDSDGNASVNNIQLIGVIEGDVDPIINTDFGEIRVYPSVTGFLYW